MRGLDGRRAIVTGAARGIGRAIALRLAEEGVSLVVNDLDDDVHDVAREIEAAGGRAVAAPGDVSDPTTTDAVVGTAAAELGGLDILVNNAGLTRDRMIHRMDDETWNAVHDVVLRGAFNMCRSAARLLRLPKEGPPPRHHRKVVNMASTAGAHGNAGNVNYSSAKAGVIGLTKALSREWAPHRINVNAVAPGFVAGTRLTAVREHRDDFGLPADVVERVTATIPIGRPGCPEDVAGVTAFLCSTDADYLAGQVVEAHGGLEIINLL